MTTPQDVLDAMRAAADDAKLLSDNALAGVDRAIQSAEQAANGIPVVRYNPLFTPVDIAPGDIAPPILPTSDFSTDVANAFDYAFSAFNQNLQPQIQNYLTAFFPDIAAAIKTGSDQWIIDTITNGRYVPIDVENALWNRAKDKEVADSLRVEQGIIDASSSRGFSSPPGIPQHAIFVNQQESSKRLTTINRDIAIKAFDVANENTKFAIEQAVKLRTAFVAALGDFIKTAMVQPNGANDYARTILAAKTGLYDSAVRLYSAQIDEERMRTGVLLENQQKDLLSWQNNSHDFDTFVDANVQSAKVQADTALKAADTLASIASAAQATRNTMTSVSGGVQTTGV